ncbi:MAG: SET domain-containing protein [Pseudomonadota bacterium]
MVRNKKTGMCVPYAVRETLDKGRGVFADTQIASGSTVWRHVLGLYTVFNESSLRSLLPHLSHDDVVYVLEHIHCMHEFPDFMVWTFEEGELINHSDNPNMCTHTAPGYSDVLSAGSPAEVETALSGHHFTLVASSDIQAGEELTLDYNDAPDDPQYYDELCDVYGLTWDWL